MSNWNYRVIRRTLHTGETWDAIHEVYYDDEGSIRGWSAEPEPVLSDEGDIMGVFALMSKSLELPILVEKNVPGVGETLVELEEPKKD